MKIIEDWKSALFIVAFSIFVYSMRSNDHLNTITNKYKIGTTERNLKTWGLGRENEIHVADGVEAITIPTDELSVSLLKVITYNTYLLQPDFFFPDSKRRLTLIANRLIQYYSDVDVVCLQEVFGKAQFDKMRELLSKTWPHSTGNIGATTWWMGDSGLFIASKHKIDYARFWNFGKYLVGSDGWAGKGVLAIGTEKAVVRSKRSKRRAVRTKTRRNDCTSNI